MKNLTKITLILFATLTALSMGAWAECSADVDMGGNSIINVADPVDDQDVVTLSYLNKYISGGDSTLTARFTRNNDTLIVTDHTTGLMWQDNFHVIDSSTNLVWSDAMDYCNELELVNGDWRVPSKGELMSIVDLSTPPGLNTPPTISNVFKNVSNGFYWSSTTLTSDSSYAWIVFFQYGTESEYTKDGEQYVRCVKNIE